MSLYRKNRPVFRENADLSGMDTGAPWKLRDFGFSLFAVFFVVSMFLLGQSIDQTRDQSLWSEDDKVVMAAAERAELERQKVSQVREAYAAGQREAYAALRETPVGLQLTQACMANGYRRQP